MFKLRQVVVELTTKCNLSCIHCGSGCIGKTKKNELSVPEWRNVLSQLSQMGVEKVVFSGGEPTLKNGFKEILLFAVDLGLRVGFISNGFAVFDKSLQKTISQSDLFAIGFSIDGLKETHNKIRRNKGSWDNLIKNISIVQDLGFPICAITTLHKLNCPELANLADFFNLAEINSWQIQLAAPFGRMAERADLLINEKDFKRICGEIMRFREAYPNLNIQSADCFGLAPKNSIRKGFWGGCSAGISSMAIDARGNVMPCLSLRNWKRSENVLKKSIVGIWENSADFNFNRSFEIKNAKGGKCESCEFLSRCRGGCASQSFSYYGRLHASPFCFFRSFIKR